MAQFKETKFTKETETAGAIICRAVRFYRSKQHSKMYRYVQRFCKLPDDLKQKIAGLIEIESRAAVRMLVLIRRFATRRVDDLNSIANQLMRQRISRRFDGMPPIRSSYQGAAFRRRWIIQMNVQMHVEKMLTFIPFLSQSQWNETRAICAAHGLEIVGVKRWRGSPILYRIYKTPTELHNSQTIYNPQPESASSSHVQMITTQMKITDYFHLHMLL